MNARLQGLGAAYVRPPSQWVFCRDVVPPLQSMSAGGSGVAPELVADWRAVHAHVQNVGRVRAAQERELCRWLLAAERLKVHMKVGYGSLREYAQRVLDLSPRQTEERLRVGRVLSQLPRLEAALSAGTICWSAARELSRIATAATEQAWLSWANDRTSREIERAVAMRKQGDEPASPPDRERMLHVLRFEVNAETMALFRDLQAAVRGDIGGAVDDDTLLHEIARRALGGPRGEGRAGYQVAVMCCQECGQVSIDAGGEQHVVNADVAEMMTCDSQRVGRLASQPPRWVEPEVLANSPHKDASANEIARKSCPHAGAMTPVDSPRESMVAHESRPHAGAMTPVASSRESMVAHASHPHAGAAAPADNPCESMVAHASQPHAGAVASVDNRRADTMVREARAHVGESVTIPERATQTIPPAIRRLVMRRDRKCCVVPGCRNHIFLDVHHLDPRAEGGGHKPERLVVLCGAHHRAVHAGALHISGSASAGLVFRHADGTPYGGAFMPSRVEAAQQVRAALLGMGFKETTASTLVDMALRRSDTDDVSSLLREALRAS